MDSFSLSSPAELQSGEFQFIHFKPGCHTNTEGGTAYYTFSNLIVGSAYVFKVGAGFWDDADNDGNLDLSNPDGSSTLYIELAGISNSRQEFEIKREFDFDGNSDTDHVRFQFVATQTSHQVIMGEIGFAQCLSIMDIRFCNVPTGNFEFYLNLQSYSSRKNSKQNNDFFMYSEVLVQN